LRIRARNLGLGGPTSVPITVSAVSEKPVAERCRVAGAGLVGPGLAYAVTIETAARTAKPESALSIGNRVALVCGGDCRRAARD
jgi:hypothetical protein